MAGSDLSRKVIVGVPTSHGDPGSGGWRVGRPGVCREVRGLQTVAAGALGFLSLCPPRGSPSLGKAWWRLS